ncbi:kinase-like protein [Suillus weaverae]|nr:kinase-like protein [Suillus weaverae]
MRRELLVWIRLKHATIVPLLGTATVESPFPALISQWMPSGTLYMYSKQVTLTVSAKVELVMGVADGLNYLHSESVVHGDLHPANVLIDGSGNPRLTDFGLATIAGDAELQLSTSTATRALDSRWRAPEIIGIERDPEKPSFKSDIFSFGGVMFFVRSRCFLQLYSNLPPLRSSQGMYHGRGRTQFKSASRCRIRPNMRVPTISLAIIGHQLKNAGLGIRGVVRMLRKLLNTLHRKTSSFLENVAPGKALSSTF